MKRKFTVCTVGVLLSASVLFNSCIGSFGLSNKLLAWNRSFDEDKWINEMMFFVLAAVQVYTIAGLADFFVLNTIEFWTGENPTTATSMRQIETEDGLYTITTHANGHKIQKEGTDEVVEFVFDKEDNSWSLLAMGVTTPLMKFVGENRAMVYLADGSTHTVTIDQAGVYALKQIVENKAYFAVK